MEPGSRLEERITLFTESIALRDLNWAIRIRHTLALNDGVRPVETSHVDVARGPPSIAMNGSGVVVVNTTLDEDTNQSSFLTLVMSGSRRRCGDFSWESFHTSFERVVQIRMDPADTAVPGVGTALVAAALALAALATVRRKR